MENIKNKDTVIFNCVESLTFIFVLYYLGYKNTTYGAFVVITLQIILLMVYGQYISLEFLI